VLAARQQQRHGARLRNSRLRCSGPAAAAMIWKAGTMAVPHFTRGAELAARRCPGLAGRRRCVATSCAYDHYGAMTTAR